MPDEYEFEPLILHKDIPLEDKREAFQKPQIITFILIIFLAIPFMITFLFPIAILFWIIKKIFCCCCRAKQEEKPDIAEMDFIKGIPKDGRVIDMVLYGASGFTGNYVAEYLARNYILGSREAKVSGWVTFKNIFKL